MADRIPDPNMYSEDIKTEDGLIFRNVRSDPFKVYGIMHDGKKFCRMPDDIAASVSPDVARLAVHTAGGRVRFSTDSDRIVLKTFLTDVHRYYHFSLLGALGFDVFVDDPDTHDSRFYRVFTFPSTISGEYVSEVVFSCRKLRYLTVNFPSYAPMDEVYIGLPADASIGPGLSYKDREPIVYYGSSITQGACASRPGNTFENIVCRATDTDYLNFGFSGSGRGEKPMVDYLASLPMSVFVSDYDYNARSVEHLRDTHCALYKAIRASHPDIPYIMLSRPGVGRVAYELSAKRKDVVADTYRFARENGDGNVYFIDGESMLRGPYEDLCLVDGVHPNDLGFALMADAILAVMRRIPLRPLTD